MELMVIQLHPTNSTSIDRSFGAIQARLRTLSNTISVHAAAAELSTYSYVSLEPLTEITSSYTAMLIISG